MCINFSQFYQKNIDLTISILQLSVFHRFFRLFYSKQKYNESQRKGFSLNTRCKLNKHKTFILRLRLQLIPTLKMLEYGKIRVRGVPHGGKLYPVEAYGHVQFRSHVHFNCPNFLNLTRNIFLLAVCYTQESVKSRGTLADSQIIIPLTKRSFFRKFPQSIGVKTLSNLRVDTRPCVQNYPIAMPMAMMETGATIIYINMQKALYFFVCVLLILAYESIPFLSVFKQLPSNQKSLFEN